MGDQAVEIHWLSIINSFVLVVLLTAFLAIVLIRVLKKVRPRLGFRIALCIVLKKQVAHIHSWLLAGFCTVHGAG